MTLSNSRQQFLAYESQTAEDIHYSRKGGVFVTTCVCVGLVIFAVVLAALVGVIVYFITYFKLSQKTTDFWDDTQPFGQNGPPSPDLRLPSSVVPSFYRLKLKTDLENSLFTGDVYITIRASKKVKEIIIHSKNLSIISSKLTEQIYEKVDTLHSRRKRDAQDNTTNIPTTTASPASTLENITESNLSTSNPTNDSTVKPNVSDLQPNSTEVTTTTEKITETSVENKANETTPTSKPSETNIQIMTTVLPETKKKNGDMQTQVVHSNIRDIKIVSITEAPGDRVILSLGSSLKLNVDYTLVLSFEGQISNSLTGFYKSSYIAANKEVKQLGVTQFEPTSARAAFPCFDEPGFKAKFEISIAHPKNLTVLSNMNVAATELVADKSDWEWTHFERSVKMSTYLVAYVICDFKSVETSYISKDNTTKPIRIWTRPEMINKAQYAANITPKLLEYYEEVFGVPYALNKLDLVAVPDFSSGAMENWGLITFRETTLLFDEATSSPRDKQNVAIDIAHELAHQWFGNLVTMQWWTDLWLNEGFATYIEYVGVDRVQPEWNMFEAFTRDMFDLLRSDALKNTSPVSRRVVDASEISQKFDEISYNKGANLIRMLNNTMTEELFHKGLVNYLEEWKFANAEENDLWKAMSTVVSSDPVLKDRSLVKFMNSWTRQAGYPVVRVVRNYETGDVKFEQNLFTTSEEPYPNMVDQIWQIPISYTPIDTPEKEWSTKPKLWLADKSTSTNLNLNTTQALYVNIDATGYYRVNYDQRNWELLSTHLKSGSVKSPVTKSQLIDDAFNLAKASQLNYSYALGLTTCVIDGEPSKIVWDLLLNNMVFLKYNLRSTSGYMYFQDYMKLVLEKQLKILNYGLDKPKDDNEAFLIENLVMWECMMESPRCLNWAKQEFNQWMDHPENNTIPSYLRSLVYNMALKYGGRREFEFLWDVFQNSTDPNVKSLIITNLPSVRDESLITLLLERSLTEIPKQYAVAAWSVEPPIGSRVAQNFLVNQFDRVYRAFTDIDTFMFPLVLSGAFGSISQQDELDRLKSLALQHKKQLIPISQTLQKLIDTAKLRIAWIARYADSVNAWFRDYLQGNNTDTKNGNLTSTIPSNVTASVVSTVESPSLSASNTTNETLSQTNAGAPLVSSSAPPQSSSIPQADQPASVSQTGQSSPIPQPDQSSPVPQTTQSVPIPSVIESQPIVPPVPKATNTTR